ncbi:MAG: nitroreductase/quinone reductase family protein [Candidatus Limnocylindrales bacterium]
MTDDPIAAALRQGGIIDITTTGRTSGEPRRIEIVFFNVEGRVYITGMPGTRAWLANLRADPSMTFHLKRGLTADLPATARIVTDEPERRAVATAACRAWNRPDQVDAFVARSPVIEVVFDDAVSVAP